MLPLGIIQIAPLWYTNSTWQSGRFTLYLFVGKSTWQSKEHKKKESAFFLVILVPPRFKWVKHMYMHGRTTCNISFVAMFRFQTSSTSSGWSISICIAQQHAKLALWPCFFSKRAQHSTLPISLVHPRQVFSLSETKSNKYKSFVAKLNTYTHTHTHHNSLTLCLSIDWWNKNMHTNGVEWWVTIHILHVTPNWSKTRHKKSNIHFCMPSVSDYDDDDDDDDDDDSAMFPPLLKLFSPSL